MFDFNLLNTALSVIPPVSFSYSRWIGKTTSEIGLEVPQYADPVEVEGHCQPTTNSMYASLGLDLEKNYKSFWIPSNVVSIDEQTNPDKITFGGSNWIVIKTVDWFSYDGWTEVIAVKEKDYV